MSLEQQTSAAATTFIGARPSKPHAIAAILNVLMGVFGVAASLPELSGGKGNTDGVPWGIVVLAFVLAILSFVSSYGVWRRQRWGVVLTIVINAVSFISGAPGIIFGPNAFLVISSIVGCIVNVVIIYLLLRRSPAPAQS